MAKIRKADVNDIPLIRSMALVAFPHTYGKIISAEQISFMMEWMYSPESLKRQMVEEKHVYFILDDDADSPAGYVSIQPQGGNVIHLQKIYVLPSAQKKGYGEMLFRHACKAAVEMNGGRNVHLELNVNRNNVALDFYKRMGMHVQSQGDFDIGNGYFMNDYIMAIDLP